MRPNRLAVLALASTALLFACGDDDNDIDNGGAVDLNGTWNFTVDVTVANGACEGEENNTVEPFPIEVTVTDANSDGTYEIIAAGFIDNPSSIVYGAFPGVPVIGDELVLTGTYPEDGGATTATYHLTIESATRLTGTEDWSWTNGATSCEGGESTALVEKVAT